MIKKTVLLALASAFAAGFVVWGVFSAEEALARVALVLLLLLWAVLTVSSVFSGDAVSSACLLVLVGAYDVCKAIRPPLPASLVALYVGFVLLAVVVFISIENSRIAAFFSTWGVFLTDEKQRLPRGGAGILLLAWVGLATYSWAVPSREPPVALRVIHPAPPSTIKVKEEKHDLAKLSNPFRADAGPVLPMGSEGRGRPDIKTKMTDGTENFAKWVDEGKAVYYQNCFYCHGDTLNGKGHFAPGFNPLPANFVDVGTIAMLQESFVFWRVAKGGPGLPKESAPWSSAMPRWEDMLSEEEIWKVILYIYEGTGHEPRTWEEH